MFPESSYDNSLPSKGNDDNNNHYTPFDANQALKDISDIFQSRSHYEEIREQNITIRKKIESEEKLALSRLNTIKESIDTNLRGKFAEDRYTLDEFFKRLDKAMEEKDSDAVKSISQSIVAICEKDHLSSSLSELSATRKFLSSDEPLEL